MKHWKIFVGIIIFILGLGLTGYATRELWTSIRDDAAARREYANLRELNAVLINALMEPWGSSSSLDDGYSLGNGSSLDNVLDSLGDVPAQGSEPPRFSHGQYYTQDDIPIPLEEQEGDVISAVDIMEVLQTFKDMNPDFIGFIVIPGTDINYPVVQGRNNDRYLHTTFNGARNPAGAIFMDYRCADGFHTPISILYGHNMRDGSMFSQLTRFTRNDFLQAHPHIIIITAGGERLQYRIVSVRRTHAWDEVFALDFNDADEAAYFFAHLYEDETRFLVLSTCVGNTGSDERLVVVAVLE
jgi:SrtB family sortase